MSRSMFLLVGLVFPACLGATGCNRSPHEMPISGEVTLDNVPIPEGSIHFTPIDGETTTQAAMIKEGKFQTHLQGTTYRVAITASRISKNPRKVINPEPGDDDPIVQELIPPRYNVRSELKLEVKEARHDVRYDLKSK